MKPALGSIRARYRARARDSIPIFFPLSERLLCAHSGTSVDEEGRVPNQNPIATVSWGRAPRDRPMTGKMTVDTNCRPSQMRNLVPGSGL